MGCSTPEAPDIESLADVTGANAELAAAVSLEQLDWAKEQFKQQMGVTNRVLNTQLPIMSETHGNAMKDRERYEKIYQPLEDNLVKEFQDYDTYQRRNEEAGKAGADITRAFDAQRENAARQLESYGIDPSQTRSMALDSNMRIQQAAAQAGAQNNARKNVEATGRALRAEAISIGKGYPSNVAGSYGQALAAGNSAVGNINATSTAGAGTMGTGQGWMGASNQGAQVGMHGLNTGYANQLEQRGQGMEMLGAVAGGAMGMMAEGGSVQGPGGPKGDAIPARLSDDEYVIPAEVMKRKGTEFFDKMISKTRKDMGLPEEAPPRHVVTPHGTAKVYTDQDGQQSVVRGGIPMASEGGDVTWDGQDRAVSAEPYNDAIDSLMAKRPVLPGSGVGGPATDIRDYISKQGVYRDWKSRTRGAANNFNQVANQHLPYSQRDPNEVLLKPDYNAGKPALPMATQQRVADLKASIPGLLAKHGIGIPEQKGGA